MSLIEFTTFSQRKVYANGLALARRYGETIEFYLDEIAALAQEIVRRAPWIQFDWALQWLLDQTIFHELLHMFGTPDEKFCRKTFRLIKEV